MTCTEVDDRLDDYLDGTLDEAAFQELELHLHGCDACREQERRLRSLLAQAAALPRELAPARDLWPDIEKRLGRRTALSFSGARGVRRAWLAGALAAAAALVVASGLALRGGGVPALPGASTGPGGVPSRAGLSTEPAQVLEAEREYAQAASVLLAALDARRERFSPETLVAVERDLRVIDQALADIRVALEKDPGSGALNHLLASTHQRKVKVLQQVVKLSHI
jgi:anti-sigma factor RsiW